MCSRGAPAAGAPRVLDSPKGGVDWTGRPPVRWVQLRGRARPGARGQAGPSCCLAAPGLCQPPLWRSLEGPRNSAKDDALIIGTRFGGCWRGPGIPRTSQGNIFGQAGYFCIFRLCQPYACGRLSESRALIPDPPEGGKVKRGAGCSDAVRPLALHRVRQISRPI